MSWQSAISQFLASSPWVVAVVAVAVVCLLGFIVTLVRSAKSNMTVRIGKIEIRRGERDPEPSIGTSTPPLVIESSGETDTEARIDPGAD